MGNTQKRTVMDLPFESPLIKWKLEELASTSIFLYRKRLLNSLHDDIRDLADGKSVDTSDHHGACMDIYHDFKSNDSTRPPKFNPFIINKPYNEQILEKTKSLGYVIQGQSVYPRYLELKHLLYDAACHKLDTVYLHTLAQCLELICDVVYDENPMQVEEIYKQFKDKIECLKSEAYMKKINETIK